MLSYADVNSTINNNTIEHAGSEKLISSSAILTTLSFALPIIVCSCATIILWIAYFTYRATKLLFDLTM